jgi:putative FmdB family regulatory protein
MPLYEYECRKCGELVEVLWRRPEDEEGLTCPACGGSELHRKLSAFSAKVGSGSTGGYESAASCPTGTCPLP